jgi:hypothetical protein
MAGEDAFNGAPLVLAKKAHVLEIPQASVIRHPSLIKRLQSASFANYWL